MRYRVKHTLKQWRQLAGMSQEELATILRDKGLTVSQMKVSFWENGKAFPDAKEIAEIEKVLKIKWSDDIVMPKQ